MLDRLRTAALLTSLPIFVLLLWRPGWLASDEIAVLRGLAGEHWYRLQHDGAPVGFYHSTVELTPDGPRFTSRLTFGLPGGYPLTVDESLTFDARPPFRLEHASRIERTDTHRRETTMRRRDGELRIDVRHDDGTRTTTVADWEYRLEDHLAVELWLYRERPEPGDERWIALMDFDRRAPTPVRWRLRAAGADGYRLTAGAPFADKVFELDPSLTPRRMSLAGMFTLTRVTGDAVRTASASGLVGNALLRVPLEAPIPNHTRVRRMVLSVNEPAARSLTEAGRLERADDGWRLVNEAPFASAPDAAGLTAQQRETADDERFAALAERAVGNADSVAEQVERLTAFVHRYLIYVEDAHVIDVADALADRRGDCTEFADLFTALAGALGIPARSVVGLAYGDRRGPGFRVHAWNEVAVAGDWRAVDPTWNQVLLDATHVRLPQAARALLQAYAAIPDMRFEVRELEYF